MIWNDRILPRLVELSLNQRVTGRWRARVCAGVFGDVLELGFGSGPNLRHYGDEVERVLAVEPTELAWRRAQPAVETFGRPVERIGLDGARVDLPDESVDAVVTTYTMCTIPDLTAALAQARRVLRPGGALHFVEHGLSPDAGVAAWQHRLQPVWGRVAGGCHLDRDIPALVAEAGFTLDAVESSYAEEAALARPFQWVTIGRATPAGR